MVNLTVKYFLYTRFLPLVFIISTNCSSSKQCCYDKAKIPSIVYHSCLEKGNANILTEIEKLASSNTSTEYDRKKYTLSIGACDYYDEPLQNAVVAVYRAIQTNLDERSLNSQTDLWLYISKIPLVLGESRATYEIYVDPFDKPDKNNSIKYEIVVLNTKVTATLESQNSVVCQVLGRFSYRSDAERYERFKAGLEIEKNISFQKMLQDAYALINMIGQSDFSSAIRLLRGNLNNFVKIQFSEIVFGDILTIFCSNCPDKTILGIYLGEGFYAMELADGRAFVLKFGQEKLFGMLIDTIYVLRSKDVFLKYRYQVPAKILECLALQSKNVVEEMLPKLEK